jgi:hypothetical protein
MRSKYGRNVEIQRDDEKLLVFSEKVMIPTI